MKNINPNCLTSPKDSQELAVVLPPTPTQLSSTKSQPNGLPVAIHSAVKTAFEGEDENNLDGWPNLPPRNDSTRLHPQYTNLLPTRLWPWLEAVVPTAPKTLWNHPCSYRWTHTGSVCTIVGEGQRWDRADSGGAHVGCL